MKTMATLGAATLGAAALCGVLAACADTAADRTAGLADARCETYALVDADDDGLLEADELGMTGTSGIGIGPTGGGDRNFPATGLGGFYECVEYEGGVGFVDDGADGVVR